MKNLKSNKGITIVALIVSIIVILILTTVTITNTYTGSDYRRYNSMCADVKLLEDKVLIYYNKYGEIPTIGDKITEGIPEEIVNVNSENDFYQLKVNQLNNITLNYGDEEDVFIINYQTFEIYYLNGIEYDDKTYYNENIFSINE